MFLLIRKKAQDSGYQFQNPGLEKALRQPLHEK
jgi:hypothetical protein